DSWNPAPDVSQTFNVAKATPTVTLKSSANPSAYGDAVHFTARVSSPAATPDGTVQFSVNGTDVGTPVTLDGSGQAVSPDMSTLALGTSIVHAAYSGSTDFTAAGSPFLIQKVVKATPTVTVTSSSNPAAYGGLVHFTAQVTSAVGSPSGTVQFRLDGVNIGAPVALDSSGKAVSPDVSPNAGSHYARAFYSGDATFVPVASAIVVQTVTKATPTVTVTSSENPSAYGDMVHFTAQVASGVGTPSGTVQFRVDGVNVGTPVALDGSGQAVSPDMSLNAGYRYVRAFYSGSVNYAAAPSAVLGQTVTKATPTVTLTSSANPSAYGDTVHFTAQVASGVGTPTGSVQFRVDGVNVGAPVALDGSGQAVSPDVSPNAGNHNVRAVYLGSTNYTAVLSPVVVQTVTRVTPTVTVTSSANPSMYEDPVHFTAQVASGAGTPTGSVQFRIDGVNVGSPVALDSSGQAISPDMTPAPGNHNVRAVYQGSANFTSAMSAILVQTVTRVVATAG
ncbi:MAG TPA: Ig-like domain-containing protein, partial [Mycobacteriales bacterium]|nr:Ig-like domain-containing protein [Mycobacteriales bacterium]